MQPRLSVVDLDHFELGDDRLGVFFAVPGLMEKWSVLRYGHERICLKEHRNQKSMDETGS